MFQADSWSQAFGGGGAAIVWPGAPDASSVLAMAGTFGPSGGKACAPADPASADATTTAIARVRSKASLRLIPEQGNASRGCLFPGTNHRNRGATRDRGR